MNRAIKTETLHIRVPLEVKEESETLLNQMGMSTSEAVNIFLRQVILNGEIPFPIRAKIPNGITKQAMYEAENGINVKKFTNAEDMFKELGI